MPPALKNRGELPRPFAGCWLDPAFSRRYKRIWMRQKRAGLIPGLRGRNRIPAADAILVQKHGVIPRCIECGGRMKQLAGREVFLHSRRILALVPWCGRC